MKTSINDFIEFDYNCTSSETADFFLKSNIVDTIVNAIVPIPSMIVEESI